MNKTEILLKQNRHLFHTRDLRILWQLDNPETLRRTISRYIKKGTLIPIYRGFYSTLPLEKIDQLELGATAIHEYSYVSTETVLVQNGIIFQNILAYTFCSTKTKSIHIGDNTYKSRQLKDTYLYNKTGIIDKGNYQIACPERAIADMLYFNPKYYFDAKDQMNQDLFQTIRKEVYGI